MNKTIIYILLFLSVTNSSCDNQVNVIKQKQEIRIDESKFVIKSLPDIIPINDSILYLNTRNRIVISNYQAGTVLKIFNFNDLINRNELIQKYIADTADMLYRRNDSIYRKSAPDNIEIFSSTALNDSTIFIAFLLKTAYISSIKGTDTELSTKFNTFALQFNNAKYTVSNARPFYLKWDKPEPDKALISPSFGMDIFNNNVYVPYITPPEYTGKIFNAFDFDSLKLNASQPSILHKPFTNNLTVNFTEFFHFQNIQNECLVNNATQIVDVISSKVKLDIKDYIPDATRINFFTPVDNENKKWFINYTYVPPQQTQNVDKQIKSIIIHNSIIDIEKQKVISDEKTTFSKLARYKNYIVSIQEKKDGYYYIVYKI
jgi:hypothetical protein